MDPFSFLHIRSDFPAGQDKNHTAFDGQQYNLTTIRHWNYTYYEGNHTVSNGSRCWLAYKPYLPAEILTNGSFVNATKCYSAVDPIDARGFIGIGLAVAYGLGLVFSLVALTKQGKRYLPVEKRFFPIGRRWQWYWALFICACALIALFLNVDVPRYHVQETPIIIFSFFWFLICLGTTALVWEAVRHWGSWLERQYIDPDPFVLREDDRRAKIEFWLPLWFYFWAWMNFFLVIPRSWKFVSFQRDPVMTKTYAIPAATSARFKAGSFMLVISWLTILYSLRHSIKHYKPRNRGVFNRTRGFISSIPKRFLLIIPLNGAIIAYQIFQSFVWDFSIMRFHGILGAQFGWGFGPPLAIIFIQIIYGLFSVNEDKELIRQRHERGEIIDRELGLVKKPAWWRRVRGDHIERSMRDKIFRNVKEVGGERGIGRREETEMERNIRQDALNAAVNDDGIEMGSMARRDSDNPRVDRAGAGSISSAPRYQPQASRYEGKNDRRHSERVVQSAASVLFPNNLEAERARRLREISEDGPPPPYKDDTRGRQDDRPNSGNRGTSTSTTNSISAQPQQIRSMLDI